MRSTPVITCDICRQRCEEGALFKDWGSTFVAAELFNFEGAEDIHDVCKSCMKDFEALRSRLFELHHKTRRDEARKLLGKIRTAQ